jgi:pimeloyl-ACP methyl ester carboxylesterase
MTGGDHPPLLLAHGYTDSGLYWTRVARALEADYNVIMPDARGHGQTPGPAGCIRKWGQRGINWRAWRDEESDDHKTRAVESGNHGPG